MRSNDVSDLGEIPPQIRRALARGLADGEPIKLAPDNLWDVSQDENHEEDSMLTRRRPTLMPERRQMLTIFSGSPLRDAKAARELATV